MVGMIGDHKVAGGGTELLADRYCLIAGDLRQFATAVIPRLVSLGFDRSLPTLFLSECVLIYLHPAESSSIVSTAAEAVDSGVFVTYEQILPDDAFGNMMLQNLKTRNIELPGIHTYPTLDSQRQRYLTAGWDRSGAIDLNEFWERQVPDEEKARINRLEIFDEVEEWRLLSAHYCVSWGVKGDKDALSKFGFS
ncbi:hypothetical protein HK104_007624 [Borealophlyctis nickersoniae]|nr:hypothetical protein HK104_007624 [Borealophlyctis nickersoniae]